MLLLSCKGVYWPSATADLETEKGRVQFTTSYHPYTVKVKVERKELKSKTKEYTQDLAQAIEGNFHYKRALYQRNPYLKPEALSPYFGVEFLGEKGLDVGGPTRELFDDLFRAIVGQSTHFKIDKDSMLALPSRSEFSIGDQNYFESIGKLFTLFFWNRTVSSGYHFQPVLFNAIHSLNAEEINTEFKDLSVKSRMKIAMALLEEGEDVQAMRKVVDWISRIDALTDEEQQEAHSYLEASGCKSFFEIFEGFPLSQALAPIHAIAKGMKSLILPLDSTLDNDAYWDRIFHGQSYLETSDKIQGFIDREALADALEIDIFTFPKSKKIALEERIIWLKEWIRDEATPLELKQYLKTQTGLTSCPTEGKKIEVGVSNSRSPLPEFSTCMYILRFPLTKQGNHELNNWDKEGFFRCLKLAISDAENSNFSSY